MKSRHLPAMHSTTYRRVRRSLPWLAALLLVFWAAGAAFAQDEADPPTRVAYVSARAGSVVFAPQGEDEWTELPQNRPLTVGDRLWTDRGARAELHLGPATLHVDGESHLGLSELDERSAQFLLQRGTVNARVRELTQGENFEIGTPNLAFRALQPGDYRIDVEADGSTRVTVASGFAAVYGEAGNSVQLRAGQQAAFAGRNLAQVAAPLQRQDAFGAWAAERNRLEDQSQAARYVPRGVVGYPQLDPYGSWGQDPTYGAVWYPRITVQDWAPYRYGHWAWVQPWGWTWVDDAPWGFAPFHYGRWTMIADRWAWVPGRLAARPVYAPALVVFLGGGDSRFSFSIGSGPGVGWYPLAPGEAWWPTYRTSPRYVNFANFNINLNAYPRHYRDHVWRQRPHAITAVREDDFRRARPVQGHRQPVQPQVVGNVGVGGPPPRPEGRRERDFAPQPRFNGGPPPEFRGMPPAVRDQFRAQREQDRLQRDAERDARRQQRDAERQQWQRPPQAFDGPRFTPPQQQAIPLRREGRGEGRGDGGRQRDDDGRRGPRDEDGRRRGWD